MEAIERYNQAKKYEQQPYVRLFTCLLQGLFWFQVAIPVFGILFVIHFFVNKLLH